MPRAISARAGLAERAATATVWAGTETARLVAALAPIGYPGTPKASADADAAAVEIPGLRRDTLLAALLAAPVVVLELGGHLVPAFHHLIANRIGTGASRALQACLTALVRAGPGRRFFFAGLPARSRGAPDMNSLVALGAGAAFL